MNEIKFRAWDKQYKQMVDVTMIMFDTQEIDFKGNNGEPKSIDHFVLNQYIGINDKNGKEIYKDDIVRVDCSGVGGAFDDGDYKVVYSLPECIFYLAQFDEMDAIIFNECYEYEVIGNIHQNPELL